MGGSGGGLFSWSGLRPPSLLNLLVQSDQNSPRQVHQHVPVLILAGAVVGMKVEADLTEAEVLQMEVEHADYSIRPLPGVYRLVNQVIHLKVFLIRAHLFIFRQHTCQGMASQQMRTSSE